MFNDSNIIKNEIDKQISIKNWIEEKTNKNILRFDLIFKMSENGSLSQDFHKACDNQGPTLMFIKTTKKIIFGGFTPLNWNKTYVKVYDELNQTFIFSLNLMKKFDMIYKKKRAIACLSSDGPNFGACDFKLNTNIKKGVAYANSNCNFLSNNNLELLGGKGESQTFETEEFEVYKVIFT